MEPFDPSGNNQNFCYPLPLPEIVEEIEAEQNNDNNIQKNNKRKIDNTPSDSQKQLKANKAAFPSSIQNKIIFSAESPHKVPQRRPALSQSTINLQPLGSNSVTPLVLLSIDSRPIKNKFHAHPAFFQVDEDNLRFLQEGSLTNQQMESLIWKFIYRLYAAHTFSDTSFQDQDLYNLACLLKISKGKSYGRLPANSAAHVAASNLIETLQENKKLAPMISLHFLEKKIKTTDKLLLHVLGDQFGKNSGLEGLSTGESLTFALQCFELLPPELIMTGSHCESLEGISVKQKKICGLLRTAMEFDNLFDKIRIDAKDKKNKHINWAQREKLPNFVIEFKTKFQKILGKCESVFIAGGWTGKTSGHCVYYKIDPQGDSLYTFTVFNRGDGVDKNASIVSQESPTKKRYAGSLQIRNIVGKDLFDNLFIQGLIELAVFYGHDHCDGYSNEIRLNDYGPNDLYDRLLPLLKGEVFHLGEIDSLDLVSPQISGTCSWKSLCAYIRTEFTFPQYKLLKYRIKQIALLNYFDQHREEFASTTSSSTLFHKSLEAFGRTLKKLSSDMQIPTGEYHLETLHMDFLLSSLADAEAKYLENIRETEQFDYNHAPLFFGKPSEAEIEKYFNSDNNITDEDLEIAKKGFSEDLFKCIRSKEWSALSLNNDLNLFLECFKQLRKKNDDLTIFKGFIEILNHIPRFNNNPFWSELKLLDIPTTKQLIINISELQSIFYCSSDSIDTKQLITTFHPVVALYKALALQDFLIAGRAEQLDLEGLDSPPDFQELEYLLTNSERDSNLGHYQWPFQSSRLRDPGLSSEIELIYTYFKQRKNSCSNLMLFCRPERSELEQVERKKSKDYETIDFTYNYDPEDLLENKKNPEIPFIKNILSKLTQEQIEEIEGVPQSTYSKSDESSEEYVQGDKFSEYDLDMQICLVLTYDEIAELILPQHFLNYRQQIQRTWFWLNNISNSNDDCSKKIKIVKSFRDDEDFFYSIRFKIKNSSIKKFSSHGIAFYLSDKKIDSGRKILDAAMTSAEKKYSHSMGKIGEEKHYWGTNLTKNVIKEIEQTQYSDKLQITNTLAYFLKHPEKLDKCECRILLNLVLFERDLLINEFLNNPFFLTHIDDFIHKAYERAKYLNQIGACCDLLVLNCRLYSYFRFASQWMTYLPSATLDIQAYNPQMAMVKGSPIIRNPQMSIEELKKLSLTTSDPNEQALIATALIVCMGEKSQLVDDDIRDLIFYHKVSSKSDAPSEDADPFLIQESKEVIWKHILQIDAAISSNPVKFLNQLIDNPTNININLSWIRESCGIFRSADKNHYFNIPKGFYQVNGKLQLNLPQYIITSRNYQKLIGKSYPATGYLNENDDLVYQIIKDENNIYFFTTVKGELQIQKKDSNGLLKDYYLNPAVNEDDSDNANHQDDESKLVSQFIPFTILEDWNIWRSETPTSYTYEITDENDQLLYISSAVSKDDGYNAYVKRACEVGPDQNLSEELWLLDTKDIEDDFKSLYQFAESSNVMIWGTFEDFLHAQRASLIEIPEYQLKFKGIRYDIGETRWESCEHPGFYLDKKQYIEPLNKLLFNAFIVLCNDEGQKKILVNIKKDVLELKDWEDTFRGEYFVFDYNYQQTDEQRKLVPAGNTEKLILAAIGISLQLGHGFLLARKLLQVHPFSMENMTYEEGLIILSIMDRKDTGDPREIALKLMAADLWLLASKNPKNKDVMRHFSEFFSLIFSGTVSKELPRYSNTCQQLSGFNLSAEAFLRLYNQYGKGTVNVDHLYKHYNRKVGSECDRLHLREGEKSIQLLEEENIDLAIETNLAPQTHIPCNAMSHLVYPTDPTVNQLLTGLPYMASLASNGGNPFHLEARDVPYRNGGRNAGQTDLVTRQNKKRFFLSCLQMLKGSSESAMQTPNEASNWIDLDRVENIRKRITLIADRKNENHYLKLLIRFLDNLHDKEVQNFIHKSNSFINLGLRFNELPSFNPNSNNQMNPDYGASAFESWEDYNTALNHLYTLLQPSSSVQELAIPILKVSSSDILFPAHRPQCRINAEANISIGRQFLLSTQSAEIIERPDMISSAPSFNEYFSKSPCTLTATQIQSDIDLKNSALEVLQTQKSPANVSKTNPLAVKVLKELEGGILECCNQAKPMEINFNPEHLPSLIEELKEYLAQQQSEIQPLELYLSNFAKSQSYSFDHSTIHFERNAGRQVNLSLIDLIFLYAKGDLSSLHQMEGVNELKDKISEFLIRATEIQKWKRCLEKANKLSKEKCKHPEFIVKELVNEFEAERVFQPDDYPAFLALEYAANIMIRNEQFDKLVQLNGSLNCILHMIPGSGKTSVLIKLLALLNADGEKLSCVILPEELFQSMQNEIIDSGSIFFNQLIAPMEVDREHCASLDYLTGIKVELQNIIKKRGAVITSPSSIHTFYLLFIESLYLKNKTQNPPSRIDERLDILKDILNIFKNQSHVLIDEIDIILDSKKYVNFSLGETQGLNEEEIDLCCVIHAILLESPEIASKVKFGFQPSAAGPKAKLLTPELYKTIKTDIAKSIAGYMEQKYVEFLTLTHEQKVEIFQFLIHEDLEATKQGLKRIELLKDQKLKNCLALAKEQLTTLLPSTLVNICGESFGFSKVNEVDLVIPYEKGEPIEGSRFGHPHEAADYTIQAALFQGVPTRTIDRVLKSIKEEIVKDMLLGKHAEETDGYRRFKEIWKGPETINPIAILPEQLIKIYEGINSDKDLNLYFTKTYLLKSIEFDVRKLSSPVGMLFFLFGEKVQGFSGTLWNSDTYPLGVKCFPEHIVDGKTICLLTKHLMEAKSQEKNPIMVVADESEKAVFDVIKHCLQINEPVYALIDGGGYLNAESPVALAKKWQRELSEERQQPLAILCHDDDSDLFLQKADGTQEYSISKVPLNDRLTIYRQPFTTGTDITHPSDAIGIVTISRNVLLRDIIQNVRRMRQLDGGQRTLLMMSQDILMLISATLNIKPESIDTTAVLRYALINQINRVDEDVVKSTLQQILTSAQSEFLNVLLSSASLDEMSNSLMPVLDVLFAPIHAINAWEMYGHITEMQFTSKILNDESSRVISSLVQALNKSPVLSSQLDLPKIENKINALKQNALLPLNSIANSTANMSQQVKVQTKQKLMIQEMPKVVLEPETKVEWKQFNWVVSDITVLDLSEGNSVEIPESGPLCVYPFVQYFPQAFFSQAFYNSVNFALPASFKVNNSAPFSQNQKVIEHAMMIKHQQGCAIVFIDEYEANIAKQLHPLPSNCCLYDLALGPLNCGNDFVLGEVLHDVDTHLALLQARLLAGFWQFSEPEKELLKQWIRCYDPEQAVNYFKNFIFKHYADNGLLFSRIDDLFPKQRTTIQSLNMA